MQFPLSSVVTKTADTNDGFCTLDDCSLCEAISNAKPANATQTRSLSIFRLSMLTAIRLLVGEVCTITPGSALPNITQSVTINGYSQPGAAVNTLPTGDNAILLIEIDGTNTVNENGLTVTAGNCAIRGLVINRFDRSGIEVSGGPAETSLTGTSLVPTLRGHLTWVTTYMPCSSTRRTLIRSAERPTGRV